MNVPSVSPKCVLRQPQNQPTSLETTISFTTYAVPKTLKLVFYIPVRTLVLGKNK